MKLKHYGMFLALGLLASCANDKLEGPNTGSQNEGDAVFMSLNVVPAGVASTRTLSPSSATEAAFGDEAKVKNALLIVAGPDNKIISWSYTDLESEATGEANITFKFDSDQYTNLLTATTSNLFVVCNIPSDKKSDMTNLTKGADVQQTLSIAGANDDTYNNSTNYFLMSNADKGGNGIVLPVTGISNGQYTQDNPYNLGTIKVQRAIARLDINKTQPTMSDEMNTAKVKIEFDGMAVVNISKDFYLFKKVGTGSNFEYFEAETASNYVLDPKNNIGTDQNLFNHLTATQTPNTLSYDLWTSIDTQHQGEIKGESSVAGKPYGFWRYVSPNTVTDKTKQKNGISTGVVFRGVITGEGLNVEAGEDLYVYYGKVIGGLNQLDKIAKGTVTLDDNGEIKNVYNNIVGEETDKTTIKNLLKSNGFTVYDNVGGKIYCYYYYWVRHNAIGTNQDGVMHEMEFGVVRNNVYKLAVTKISGLGKPGYFTPDPNQDDDPKPEDNPTEAYLEVSLEVVPWGVRVDDIEF